jgi:hypothetical protein
MAGVGVLDDMQRWQVLVCWILGSNGRCWCVGWYAAMASVGLLDIVQRWQVLVCWILRSDDRCLVLIRLIAISQTCELNCKFFFRELLVSHR